MKIKSVLHALVLSMAVVLLGACQSFDESLSSTDLQQGKFVVEYPKGYSISMTRGTSNSKKWSKSTMNGDLEIMETEWNENTVNSTRSSDLKDDVNWQDAPLVGLYISDSNGNLKVKNVPLNPLTHVIQNYWYDETKKGSSYDDVFTSVVTEQISSSSFFWDSWSQKGQMPEEGIGANFYGIYPRPFDHIPNAQYNYTRNSVISSSTVDNDDNCVSYVFWEAQTDQNIKQFDLMYSQSESASENGIYGNKDKKKGESILMPFVHAFSLLNIEIYKGKDYTGAGLLSSISLKGTEISTSGTLNYVTGELTKGTDEGVINRIITEKELSLDEPFQTEVIVPPFSDNATVVEGKEKLSIICKIDGNEYKYNIPDNVKLKSGMKYDIKLTLSPSGLSYMNVWYGAEVTLDNSSVPLDYGSKAISGNNKFTVKAKDGYIIEKITKNGEIMSETTGTFSIDKNCTYNIVAYPESDWYVQPENMRVQFDGILNTAYGMSQNKDVSIWQDLTGNGNDGNLKSFNGTKDSGWNNTNGLVFDGVDDIVIFPGNINAEEYTMEFFLAFDKQKSDATPRLNAEGTAYPAYYLRKMKGDNKWHVGLYGHNCPQYDSDLSIEEDNSLVQLDMVYQNKKVKFYKDGKLVNTFDGHRNSTDYVTVMDAVSIPEASLGNRSADNTRTTTGTYYSYILYDKALDETDINKNLELNQKRFNK